jgi:DNA repair ATPase RecN
MKNAQSGKLSLSEFIESLIRSQTSLIQHIANNDLQAMSNTLPDLCNVSAEFKELTVMLRSVEAKLQETLNHVHNSCEELRTGTINKFLFSLSCILYSYITCLFDKHLTENVWGRDA